MNEGTGWYRIETQYVNPSITRVIETFPNGDMRIYTVGADELRYGDLIAPKHIDYERK